MLRPMLLILPLILGGIVLAAGRSSRAPRGVLLVANKGDATLGIIDAKAGKQVATVAENGITGHEVVASPDGKFAYVPVYGNSGVGKPGTDGSNMVVVDIASRKVVGNLDFGHGVRPHCPMFRAEGWAALRDHRTRKLVTAIDPRNLKILAKIPTGHPESHMLAITHDGHYGYTANVGSGTVSVLDLESRKLIDTIAVSPQVQRISLSVDDRLAFTSDQTKPQLAIIDTRERKVRNWVALPATGYGTAATPDGKWLLIALPGAKKVAVLNLSTLKIEHLDRGTSSAAGGVGPSRWSGRVRVCDASHQVAAIQTSTWKVSRFIDAGPSADGLAWARH